MTIQQGAWYRERQPISRTQTALRASRAMPSEVWFDLKESRSGWRDTLLSSKLARPPQPRMLMVSHPRTAPRIAVLGFAIECNRFAPVATRADFLSRGYWEGDALTREARREAPSVHAEIP